jgi:PPOX class probable F420-dependent enzyme
MRERGATAVRLVTSVANRFYHWIRHPAAHSLASQERTVRGFEHLRGYKYCLLVTYKPQRRGGADSRVVRFGRRQVYVRSEANFAKVKRIRNHSQVRVAPCTVRGEPLGPPAEGQARVLDASGDEAKAEAALQGSYGLGRKVYQGAGGALGVEVVYLEIAPV